MPLDFFKKKVRDNSQVEPERKKVLYIFLDEAGNFDFSVRGTTYFSISSLSMIRPFSFLPQLVGLKYDLWEKGIQLEYFHAAEDRQVTRDAVFKVVRNHLGRFRLDSIIVEKRKTNPTLQKDEGRFYKTVFDILLRYVLDGYRQEKFDRAIIITDTIPVERKRRDLEKAIKATLSVWSRKHEKEYDVVHYASKSDLNLQIVDYLNWAVFRKWERGDPRSYDLIKAFVATEFDVFRRGKNLFY